MTCRFCGTPLEHVMCDLGTSPLANNYLDSADIDHGETHYPLRVLVCGACHLAQLGEFKSPEDIFRDYAYYSSYSTSWLNHVQRYAERMIPERNLTDASLVIELASNDGYLLQYFQRQSIPVLGVEPAANVAAEAERRGIPTVAEFFGTRLARELRSLHPAPDLIVANNVLAHVPDINDFVGGVAELLRPGALATLEFPHLLRLLAERQFDTIYHEHFSYLSLMTVQRIFSEHRLRIVDVEELPTHGGSLRIHVVAAADPRQPTPAVEALLSRELASGLDRIATYVRFAAQVRDEKRAILGFLLSQLDHGRTLAGYGAPAKGNTMLNYCGIGPELLPFTVDRSPHKQGRYLPGVRIPILPPEALRETRPDVVLILPWNLRDEIMRDLADVRTWGGQFAARTPDLQLLP